MQPVTGRFVRKIALQASPDSCRGIAMSPDGALIVVSRADHTLSVYSLLSGQHIRTFGKQGSRKGRFNGPAKLCFSVDGNILVAELDNKRAQEVTLTGDHVRFIGVGVIRDSIVSIAANAELIVVGKHDCTTNKRIMMFDAVTGEFKRAFGDYGNAPGQLMKRCNGIRFTTDNHHIIVAEGKGDGTGGRLSMFTRKGEFVKCIGGGELKSAGDVEFADNGDIIMCDACLHRVCVYSAEGSMLLRLWSGTRGEFNGPDALVMCHGQLLVLDDCNGIQVFE